VVVALARGSSPAEVDVHALAALVIDDIGAAAATGDDVTTGAAFDRVRSP